MIIKISKKLVFLNVGEPNKQKLQKHNLGVERHTLRKWENCMKYGFLSAGQGKKWSDQIKKLEVHDIVCAYITERGFVGIGECISEAVPIRNFKTKQQKFLREVDLLGPTYILQENIDDDIKCEYAVGIEWLPNLTIKNKEKAFSVTGQHLGITQHIYTELTQNTPKFNFIKNSFSVDFIF